MEVGSLHHVASGYGTQVVKLGGSHLHPLSHLASPREAVLIPDHIEVPFLF